MSDFRYKRLIDSEPTPIEGRGVLLCRACDKPANKHKPYRPCPEWTERELVAHTKGRTLRTV